ncbi:zinc-binding dehydrogenase [Halobacillus amylolyticus]|uniref:Zinc-binding dehydrogenase n=1 Tax=Halobacillus amylolyticus TaxID=2932259 RepID=A0ABY4HFQ1_9BACI|nr:zinc-binding dehydrogenase [Halobacillus amylolyticus]
MVKGRHYPGFFSRGGLRIKHELLGNIRETCSLRQFKWKIGNFKTKELHASCRSILGYSLGTTRKERPETLSEAASEILKYISNGQLNIKIGKEFPLEEAGQAHQPIESEKYY